MSLQITGYHCSDFAKGQAEKGALITIVFAAKSSSLADSEV